METSLEFDAEYTAKDLILYALAIGFGSLKEKTEEDLMFLYENHPEFAAVPTFCVALAFWANQDAGISHGIQPFPPPLMRKMGLLPRSHVRGDIPTDLTALHTWQSITWHRPLPVPTIGKGARFDDPVRTTIRGRFLSVVPKRVGTFVTSENGILCSRQKSAGEKICTLQSTTLVLGMPREKVTLYQAPKDESSPSDLLEFPSALAPSFEFTYETTSTQALLYRVASGDSNSIHADTSAAELLGVDESRPLLHGLCTLGFAIRAIFCYLGDKRSHTFVRYLEGQFTKPVWVGDVLGVRIWTHETPNCDQRMIISFIVYDKKTNITVVDRGIANIQFRTPLEGSTSDVVGVHSKM